MHVLSLGTVQLVPLLSQRCFESLYSSGPVVSEMFATGVHQLKLTLNTDLLYNVLHVYFWRWYIHTAFLKGGNSKKSKNKARIFLFFSVSHCALFIQSG